jgi:hypothetical protein
MTLYEKVKAALKKGAEPEQIAGIFGISVTLVKQAKALMESSDSEQNKK